LGEVIPQGFNQPIGVYEVKWQEGHREQRLLRQIEALGIEVDEVNKERQVAEITETDYFARLEDKVRKLRQK